MSQFFSCKVTKKGTPTPFVPRPVEMDGSEEVLQLSQACIPASVDLKHGTRVSVNIKTADMEEPVALATMVVGQLDTVSLGLILDGYAEFTIDGPAKSQVHLTGFYNPQGPAGGGDDDDDEDAIAKDSMLAQLIGAPSGLGEIDDDDEDDDGDEEDFDDEEDSDEDLPIAGKSNKKTKVEITEIKPESGKNGAAPKTPSKAQRDQEMTNDKEEDGDEDDEQEDEDDEDDEEDEDDDEEDEEDEEQAAPQPSPAKPNGKNPASNQKRALEPTGTPSPSAPVPKRSKVSKFANGFEVHSLYQTTDPTAAQAAPGKQVYVRYRGTLENGKVFDETKGSKRFGFKLGVGDVIKGWDKGVVGMRVGDKRKLIVPPSMAYGSTGVQGVIPKNATLTFEVELVKVR